MLQIKSQKIPIKYECIKCNYITVNKKDYNKHLTTAKHKKVTNVTNSYEKNASVFKCDICNKIYKSRMGLWRHKQQCNEIYTTFDNSDTNDISSKTEDSGEIVETMMQLIKQNQELIISNQEFKELISEQNKTIIELSKKDNGNTYNNNNTINNNNQKFNLNFFLNTTCKDAMNMSDFIENMEINFKDIENIGKNGYVNGMTEMILSRIKELDVTKRPLHCTDLKRETMYIKDNDEWCKDTPENTKLRKTIGYVAKRNYATIPLWREKYPECQNWNDPKYDFCVDMMRNILGDIGEKQTRLDNKVIKNLSKHITVEKNV
jgi:hypothetical protein